MWVEILRNVALSFLYILSTKNCSKKYILMNIFSWLSGYSQFVCFYRFLEFKACFGEVHLVTGFSHVNGSLVGLVQVLEQ